MGRLSSILLERRVGLHFASLLKHRQLGDYKRMGAFARPPPSVSNVNGPKRFYPN